MLSWLSYLSWAFRFWRALRFAMVPPGLIGSIRLEAGELGQLLAGAKRTGEVA